MHVKRFEAADMAEALRLDPQSGEALMVRATVYVQRGDYRQALAEDNHVIQPFDQDKWAKSSAAYGTEQALSTFAALRQWNLALLRSLTPEQLARPLSHPERGSMILRTIIETSAGHDINHLRQLDVAKQAAA